MTTTSEKPVRLTQFAAGGGCACKVPPGELERVLAGLPGGRAEGALLVGLENGDDGAAVQINAGQAVIATADFFTPVVDDAYDWGRIAAANALSDVYAMGGEPILAVNLLAWPRDRIPFELAAEVLRGGADVCLRAGAHLAGGHSIDDPEPKYGLAVTGLGHPERLLRNDAGRPGVPLTLTKPLGLGVLNNRHKATGVVFPEAVEVMTRLNRDASRAALEAGAVCATDVTGRLVPVVQHAQAERLGEREGYAGPAAVVAQQPVGVREPGHRETVLRLRVVDAVSTGEVRVRLEADVGAAAQHLGSELERDPVARPGQQVHRHQRVPAHRVDVGQRVDGGDQAPVVGVVHDRREEVRRGNHRAAARPLVDPYGGTVVAVL